MSFAETGRTVHGEEGTAIEQVLRLECAWNVPSTTKRPVWPGEWGVRSQGKEGERGPQTMKVSAETGAFSLVRGHPLEDFQQLRDIF